MSDLRTAAQQALEVINDTAYGAPVFRQEVRDTITALRAALAQQKDPTDPGNDVDALREHVRHLERRIRELHAQQAEPLNLRDPAVQKRLAAQWGYVPAAQAEPVQESVHEHEDWCASVTQLLLCDPPRKAPCNCKHTAPPQQRPLTEEEIERIGMKHVTLREVIRAVERAHGIKE